MIESQDTFDFAKIHQLGFEERFFFLSGFSFTHIHNSQDSSEVCVWGGGGGGGYNLTPLYHFQPLHRHLDIRRAMTAESSPLHIASSQTRTGNLWFPSTSR